MTYPTPCQLILLLPRLGMSLVLSVRLILLGQLLQLGLSVLGYPVVQSILSDRWVPEVPSSRLGRWVPGYLAVLYHLSGQLGLVVQSILSGQ